MAKKKSFIGPPMPHGHFQTVDVKPLLAHPTDERVSSTIYANHAQFTSTTNEIFIDLYRLEPEGSDPNKVTALFIQRIAIPLGLGKGFATGLANVMARLETIVDHPIPNNRPADPEDLIKIWD